MADLVNVDLVCCIVRHSFVQQSSSHHLYIPGNVPKICYSESNSQNYSIVSKYFAPINESIAGSQRKEQQMIPGKAANGSIERSFIMQRFVICSYMKLYHVATILRTVRQATFMKKQTHY